MPKTVQGCSAHPALKEAARLEATVLLRPFWRDGRQYSRLAHYGERSTHTNCAEDSTA